MATPAFLPYGRQLIEDDDVAAVAAALRADYLTTGPTVEAFERAFAERVGAAHAVACSSGTAALHLAALALGLGPGDWLIVPSMTFLATANAARFVGAEVQFADVDADTGLLTEATLAEALDRAKAAGRTVKAISVVHLAGRTASLRTIAAIARDLPIVEDACHALGTTYEDAGSPARVGDARHGTLATFSFHPVKTIAVGEGGMITTKDAALAARMRLARNHGMTRDPEAFRERAAATSARGKINPWYYEMHEPGYNYRLPDILCALGLSQLAKLDRFTARRRALAARYDAALAPLAPAVRIVPPVPGCHPVLHLYVVLIDFPTIGMSREQVMAGLRARGIGTQVHYIPVHRQPYYRGRYGDIALPGADAYYRRALSLPLFPAMSDDDVIRVTQALAQVLGRR
jgi:UDP-4-amino-4,6-dideoxy-N-acetyl-beta-L-altrosamine transaminase